MRIELALVIILLSAGAALAQAPTYQEPPSLAGKVAKGDLPPIEKPHAKLMWKQSNSGVAGAVGTGGGAGLDGAAGTGAAGGCAPEVAQGRMAVSRISRRRFIGDLGYGL